MSGPGQELQAAIDRPPPDARTGDGPARRPRRRLALKVLVPLLVLAAGALGFAVLVQTRPQAVTAGLEERVWTVETVRARFGPAQPEMVLYGQIVAGREVELRALVAGEIVEVGPGLREGAWVEAGERILRIDPFDHQANLEERQAQLAEAHALLAQLQAQHEAQSATLRRERQQYVFLERDVVRQRTLHRSGSVAERALDNAELELSRAGQRVNVAESTLAAEAARMEQQRAALTRLEVGVRRAERDLQNTALTAPFAGFMTDIQAHQGKQVGVGDRIAGLIDSAWLEARVNLSDAQFGRLLADGGLAGQQARLLWHAGGVTRSFDAELERQAGRVDSATGGITLFARVLDLTPDTPLRPGVFVEVRMPDRRFDAVAALPANALYDRDHVYVVDEGGRLAPRQVGLAAHDGNLILVQDGLEEGEQVLITRFAAAGPGVRVNARPAQGEGAGAGTGP